MMALIENSRLGSTRMYRVKMRGVMAGLASLVKPGPRGTG